MTQPITSAVQGVPGLKSTTATSREGSATVQVEFDFGTDLDRAVAKLESSLNQVQGQLPQGVDPTVFAGSTDNFPVVVLAASASGDEKDVADRLRTTVIPQIKKITGVREADVTGDRDETLVITPDPAKVAAAGVDASAIGAALKANGTAAPTGTLTDGEKSLTVQVGTPFNSVDDLRNLYVIPGAATGAPTGGAAGGTARAPVKLGDIAEVSEQLAPPTSITRTNGKPSLGISVTATPDGNAVAHLRPGTRRPARAARRRSVRGAQLTPVFDQAPFVEKSIDGLTTEGALGLADGRTGDPDLPALDPVHAGHRGLDPAVGDRRADRAVDRRLLPQRADPGRADHRRRPGGRRLDCRAGEHQATSRVRRGQAATPSSPRSRRWPAR